MIRLPTCILKEKILIKARIKINYNSNIEYNKSILLFRNVHLKIKDVFPDNYSSNFIHKRKDKKVILYYQFFCCDVDIFNRLNKSD